MKEILYEFLYCPCIHESGWVTVSLHRTREGAQKALDSHKDSAKKEFNERYSKEEIEKLIFKFGQFEDWRIGEIELND